MTKKDIKIFFKAVSDGDLAYSLIETFDERITPGNKRFVLLMKL